MTKEQAEHIIFLYNKIERLAKEVSDLESVIKTLEVLKKDGEFSEQEKIQYIDQLLSENPEVIESFSSCIEKIMEDFIVDKKKEIAEAEQELIDL